MNRDVYVLVMAGGRGTRFWPLSRRERPKQCISIGGGPSLLRATIDRLLPMVPPERILVATGRAMEASVRLEIPDVPADNVLVEPEGRNTAPCIGWGAVEVGRRGGGGSVLCVLPSDHRIEDEAAFRSVIGASAETARATNALIALGVAPTRPETGFGYLEMGVQVGAWGGRDFFSVERFVEKPNLETAERYVTGGRHLWNAGMFVFTVESVRDAFRTYLPESAVVLEELYTDPSRLEELWPRLDATSIDYGIMEKSRHIFAARCDMGWSDVGSWTAAAELMDERDGGVGVAVDVIAIESRNCVVQAPDRVVALIGVQDLVVVDSGGALLVMHRSRAQQVGRIVDALERRGLERMT